MLLWLGFAFLLAGVACFGIDRRAAHYFHDEIHQDWAARIHRTTDWAKGALWLQFACVAFAGSWITLKVWPNLSFLHRAERTALAFLASLAVASVILHSIKILLGRRRPRDELELGLFGWRPLGFDLQYDSFPSGHALTIFCVAVIMSGVLPQLAALWLAIAVYLALTRVFLNSHFLSDIAFGAGIALIVTRAVLLAAFPDIARPWF